MRIGINLNLIGNNDKDVIIT